VAPAPPSGNTESGGATWYRHAAGECAHKTLARGTVVTVTNQANGATATCTVTDRGPYGDGRIIDLDVTVFEQLAPLDAGVIQVVITW
jgi:rare lipoprotein A